jgi:hypothetical protein
MLPPAAAYILKYDTGSQPSNLFMRETSYHIYISPTRRARATRARRSAI